MVELDDTEMAIKGELERVVAGGKIETSDIKKVLRRLGESQRRCSGNSEGSLFADSGWLYDFTWAEMDRPKERGQLLLIHLAVESELSSLDPEMDGDFHKLIQVRAEHRLWIFACLSREDVEKYMKRCVEHIGAFQRTVDGDRYLMVGFYDNRSRCLYGIYVHKQGLRYPI